MSHLIFVYGTLKRGFPNHAPMLSGERLLGLYRTREALPMVISGRWFSPVVFPERGIGHRVVGELYALDDAKLAAMDHLESVHLPSGYIREAIEVEPADGGAAVTAWIYMKPRDRVAIVHSDHLADYQDRRYVKAADRPKP